MYYVLSSTKLNQVKGGLAQTSEATLGEQRRDGEGYALRDGDWRGRIEALCTVGLTASALVQKRSVRLPMVACGSVFAGRCSRDCPSDAMPISISPH
jgi:hypothetical protein